MFDVRTLTDHALLEVLVSGWSATEPDTRDREMRARELARRLSSSLAELAAATHAELVALGLSDAQATHMLASVELIKRSRASRAPPPMLSDPNDVYDFVLPFVDDAEREHFVVVVLDVRNRPRAAARIGTSSVDHCVVDPRDVFAPALRHNGTSVIVAHNHPSGDPSPSAEDVALTRRLIQAGKVLGVAVLDHLILGTGPYASEERRYVSLLGSGLMAGKGSGGSRA